PAVPAKGGAPADTPKSSPSTKLEDKRVDFKQFQLQMRGKQWKDVLEWLSDQTGIPVISRDAPQGGFNYFAPKDQTAPQIKSIPEVIDILNEALIDQHYIIVRREASFLVVAVDDQFRFPDVYVPRITVDELPRRGKTEIVSVVLNLKTLSAEE